MSGFLLEWYFYATASAPITLQVWRPRGHNKYTLVAQTMCDKPTVGENVVKAAETNIQVYKGDVIGFQFQDKNVIPFDVVKGGKTGDGTERGVYILHPKEGKLKVNQTLEFREFDLENNPHRQYSVALTISREGNFCYFVKRGRIPPLSRHQQELMQENNALSEIKCHVYRAA